MIFNKCYHRNKKPRIYFECNICDKLYPCKACHNEKEGHDIGKNIDKIVCGYCETKQEISNKCITCGIQFTKNYCNPCRTYLNNSKFYHCEKCNECRAGKREDSFHCDNCNMCLGIHLKNNHKCINYKEEVCYVCFENIYRSYDKIFILKCCKHPIHNNCLKRMIQTRNFNCGLCRNSLKNQFIRTEAII